MKKPNLLFLFTDEQRADSMAAYGNTKIDTPHLNRLAEESIVFPKCYVSQPVCTPSRSTIMTGLYPHTNGCTANNIPLELEVPCLPEMLPERRTAYFGKWHLGDEIYAQHGFDHWISIEDGYVPHYREGRDRNDRSTYHHWLVAHGHEPQGARPDSPGVFPRSVATRMPEEHCKPAYLAGEFARWLEAHPKDEPFVAYVNFLEPHMPFFGPRDDQYDPAAIPLPANFSDFPGPSNHPKSRLLLEHYRRRGIGDQELATEAGWRRLIANYWGLVSQVDTAVGRILAALEASGLAGETIVVFTSDHGDMMGSHRLLAKTLMFEEAVTVPLLIRAPGLVPRREPCAVSQIDLVPTLLDLMGVPIPEALQGQSLCDLLSGGAPPAERDIFIEWNGPDCGIGQFDGGGRMPNHLREVASPDEVLAALRDPVRTIVSPDGWKLNHSPALGAHELFNLREDPCERTNRYGELGTEPIVAALRERLHAWGCRTHDEVAAAI